MFAILKHSVPKKVNFPEGMGFFFIVFVENPKGRGVAVFFFFKWKIQGGGGVLSELPSMVGGLDIFWNHTFEGDP